MRSGNKSLARLLVLGACLPSAVALADVTIRPGVSGQRGTFSTDGNLTVDGHCFGNVSGVPTGGVLRSFGGTGSFVNGNLFVAGPITELSTTFPDGINVRDGSTNLASITSAGSLYLRGSCINSSGCSNTKFQPSLWNDGGWIQGCNNCYNYGNDTRTDNYAQPGLATGAEASYPYTVDGVKAAAVSDGLTWIGAAFPGNTYDCGKGHLIFMAIRPSGSDYHWWRLDQTVGLWSHKPATGEATDLDYSSPRQAITNPLTSNRGSYTTPGGFFCNCGSKANIRGRDCSALASRRAAAAAPAFDSEAAYSVVLDVFSGRPNPVLDLTADEVAALGRLLGGTCGNEPLAKPADYPASFLGYRGMTVFRSAPGTGRNPSLRLARGVVRVSAANVPDACKAGVRSSADHSFADMGQTVEKYLVEVAHARKVIDDIVYNDIVADMQTKP